MAKKLEKRLVDFGCKVLVVIKTDEDLIKPVFRKPDPLRDFCDEFDQPLHTLCV